MCSFIDWLFLRCVDKRVRDVHIERRTAVVRSLTAVLDMPLVELIPLWKARRTSAKCGDSQGEVRDGYATHELFALIVGRRSESVPAVDALLAEFGSEMVSLQLSQRHSLPSGLTVIERWVGVGPKMLSGLLTLTSSHLLFESLIVKRSQACSVCLRLESIVSMWPHDIFPGSIALQTTDSDDPLLFSGVVDANSVMKKIVAAGRAVGATIHLHPRNSEALWKLGLLVASGFEFFFRGGGVFTEMSFSESGKRAEKAPGNGSLGAGHRRLCDAQNGHRCAVSLPNLEPEFEAGNLFA